MTRPQSGDSNRSRGRSKRRRGRGRPQRDDAAVFWGDPGRIPDPRTDVRITREPAAVPRSLGDPPLPGHEAIADHYFAAVYERAVATAAALAAAGGLADADELEERLGD